MKIYPVLLFISLVGNNYILNNLFFCFKGMAANATRELIKEKFNPFTKTPWIDFNKGDAEVKYCIIIYTEYNLMIMFRHGYD